MRAYAGATAQEVQEFLNSALLDVSDVYAATANFISANSDLDEEEIEFTLSLIAAEDALGLVNESSGRALVLAFDIPAEIIVDSHEMSVSLSESLKWEYLECCFEVSEDGEDLTWFATQEITNNLPTWLA